MQTNTKTIEKLRSTRLKKLQSLLLMLDIFYSVSFSFTSFLQSFDDGTYAQNRTKDFTKFCSENPNNLIPSFLCRIRYSHNFRSSKTESSLPAKLPNIWGFACIQKCCQSLLSPLELVFHHISDISHSFSCLIPYSLFSSMKQKCFAMLQTTKYQSLHFNLRCIQK